MVSTAAKARAYTGPAILSFGFRPFFLGGAIWAALAVALWLPLRSGTFTLPTSFEPLQWHIHELLYGYLPAIVAGFLLTAVPNWTGRLPVVGTPLLVMFATWLAGRIAIMISGILGTWLTAIIDLSFLILLTTVIAREIIAGGNLRNLKVLILVALLVLGNAIFHLEHALDLPIEYGTRTGIATAVLLITLIGGRVIPSFTRNWLVQNAPGRLPIPFGKFDAITVAVTAFTLLIWVLYPNSSTTAALCVLAGLMQFARLARWAGDRTFSQPIVLVLHIGYVFVPIGFALKAMETFIPGLVLPSGPIHAWTAGAIGLMTLAIMTRASLGHTGQAIKATPAIMFIYVFASLAALSRLVAAFDIERPLMLQFSALNWVLAFIGFAVVYGPCLLSPRKRSR